jgi:hypothetical protein
VIVALRTEADSVLSVVAPLGLAAAGSRPALMVDLDPGGPGYPGERSLADLVAEGPRRLELAPEGPVLAVLRNGGTEGEGAIEAVESLGRGWPTIVVRVTEGARPPWPVIPLVPLLPGILAVSRDGPAVWQATIRGQSPPGPGPVLPPLTRAGLAALLRMRQEPAGRWVRAWRQVWELPWG